MNPRTRLKHAGHAVHWREEYERCEDSHGEIMVKLYASLLADMGEDTGPDSEPSDEVMETVADHAISLCERWRDDQALRIDRLANHPTEVELLLELERMAAEAMLEAEDGVIRHLDKSVPAKGRN